MIIIMPNGYMYVFLYPISIIFIFIYLYLYLCWCSFSSSFFSCSSGLVLINSIYWYMYSEL